MGILASEKRVARGREVGDQFYSQMCTAGVKPQPGELGGEPVHHMVCWTVTSNYLKMSVTPTSDRLCWLSALVPRIGAV